MLEEQRVFAVRFALEARFLLHRVILSIAGRAGELQLLDAFHENEWLEHRPGGVKTDKVDCPTLDTSYIYYIEAEVMKGQPGGTSLGPGCQ